MNISADQFASLPAAVRCLKENDQDFEWYPTTNEILEQIKADIKKMQDEHFFNERPSILDCGAGNGRALCYLTEGDRFAIEKSPILQGQMDRSIFRIGADFHQQTLFDKKVNIVFCNPPYSEYESWCEKILKETVAAFVYLVIPSRWKNNQSIMSAIENRQAETSVLGSFDFTGGERPARAVVDIVKVKLAVGMRCESAKTDPFDQWFNEYFQFQAKKSQGAFDVNVNKEEVKKELEAGGDLVTILVKRYDRELDRLLENYRAIERLNPVLLDELGASKAGLAKGLQQKIEGLKNSYWNTLIEQLKSVNERLTLKSRKQIWSRLTANTGIDFNIENIHAVVGWIISNVNYYVDDQLTDLVVRMSEPKSIVLYKSNQKVYKDSDWRFGRTPKLDHYALDHRIILHRVGGLCVSQFSFDHDRYNGLSEGAYTFLVDILAVARNLGFDTSNSFSADSHVWKSNKGVSIQYFDPIKRTHIDLMTVRAFQNGNLHIKFNQRFILALNVEFGRLKGWVGSEQDATFEMNADPVDVKSVYECNIRITTETLALNSL